MALHEALHHVGLARGAEGGAELRRYFLVAISMSMMSPRSISNRCIASSMRSISRQVGEGGLWAEGLGVSGGLAMMGVSLGPGGAEISKHCCNAHRQADLTGRIGGTIWDYRRGQFEPVGLQATLNNLLKGRGVFETRRWPVRLAGLFCWASA